MHFTKKLGIGAVAAAMSLSLAGTAQAVDLQFFFPVAVGGKAADTIEALTNEYAAAHPDVKIDAVYAGSYQNTITKALTAAILAVLGDLVVQYLRTRDKRGELAKLSVEALQKLRPSLGHGLFPLHQPLQTAAFALHGLLLAPLGHAWYTLLEKVLGRSGGAVGLMLRGVLDRLVYDPLQLMATLLILGNLVGPSPGAVLAGLAGRSGATDVFWVSLVANWRVWLPAQLLNYALVPPHLRVLFGNAVSICWNMTLAARIATGLAD